MLYNFDQEKVLAIKQLGGKQGLIKFMSKECDCPEETYSDYNVYSILKSLLIELDKECTKENLMFSLNDAINIYFSSIDKTSKTYSYNELLSLAIDVCISTVNSIKVYDSSTDTYINGFDEECVKNFEEKYAKNMKNDS